MSDYRFEYAVTLVADAGQSKKPTHESALSLLQDFLQAHDGEHVGFFEQNGETYDDIAVVKISDATAELLQDLNVSLLRDRNKSPFVSRIEGELFDICRANGMVIHPNDSLERYEMGLPF